MRRFFRKLTSLEKKSINQSQNGSSLSRFTLSCTLNFYLQLQRAIKHIFFTAVTYVDEMIGQVLHSLVENGHGDNTIVTLIGDHGWMLGENQVRQCNEKCISF